MKLKKTYGIEKLIAGVPGVVEVVGGSPVLQISAVDPIDLAQQGSLTWIRGNKNNQGSLAERTRASLVVCEQGDTDFRPYAAENRCFVVAKDAKLAMVHMLSKCTSKAIGIAPTAVISPHAKLGEQASVGHGAIIGNATIGNNVSVASNVIIQDDVFIGDNVVIHPQVIIGGFGFNYATDPQGGHHPFPHLGGVKIGANCEIGAHSFISSGVLGDTQIGVGTKIAQFVYIGANVRVGVHCQIRPRVSVMGSVTLGDRVVVAPTATLRDEITVGDDAVVGMGALVLKSVPAGKTVYGAPAKIQPIRMIGKQL